MTDTPDTPDTPAGSGPDSPEPATPTDGAAPESGAPTGAPAAASSEHGVAAGDEAVPTGGGPKGRVSKAAVAALVGALVLGGGLAVATRGGGGCPADGAVVEARGRTVDKTEFNRRLELLNSLYGVQAPTNDAAKARAFLGDVAKSVAVGLMIQDEVADRRLTTAEKAVRDALDNFVAERFPDGGRAKFIESLGNQGVAEADVLAEFRRLIETQNLFEQVTADVKVSDAEVAQKFEQQKDSLAVPENRKLRHLVVATEAEAKAALARVQGGTSFATVATSVSLDSATKANGGDLGPLPAGQLAKPFAAAAFAAPVNQPFGPIQTEFGWHVGVVEQIILGRPVTLDEVKTQFTQRLVGEAKLAEWRRYLGAEIKHADACYDADFRPDNPDAPPPDINPAPTAP